MSKKCHWQKYSTYNELNDNYDLQLFVIYFYLFDFEWAQKRVKKIR